MMPGMNTFEKVTLAAAIMAASVYSIALVSSFFLPEPKQEELPE